MSDVVIVVASNNKNMHVAQEFEKVFHAKNIKTKIVDVISMNLPLYTPVEENKGIPKKVLEDLEIFDNAKSYVFIAPEYNGGVPPTLSNLIAWISRSGNDDWRKYFNGKSAAIASFSGGGGIQMLAALRLQLSYIGLNVVGRQVRATFREELNLNDVQGVAEQLIKNL